MRINKQQRKHNATSYVTPVVSSMLNIVNHQIRRRESIYAMMPKHSVERSAAAINELVLISSQLPMGGNMVQQASAHKLKMDNFMSVPAKGPGRRQTERSSQQQSKWDRKSRMSMDRNSIDRKSRNSMKSKPSLNNKTTTSSLSLTYPNIPPPPSHKSNQQQSAPNEWVSPHKMKHPQIPAVALPQPPPQIEPTYVDEMRMAIIENEVELADMKKQNAARLQFNRKIKNPFNFGYNGEILILKKNKMRENYVSSIKMDIGQQTHLSKVESMGGSTTIVNYKNITQLQADAIKKQQPKVKPKAKPNRKQSTPTYNQYVQFSDAANIEQVTQRLSIAAGCTFHHGNGTIRSASLEGDHSHSHSHSHPHPPAKLSLQQQKEMQWKAMRERMHSKQMTKQQYYAYREQQQKRRKEKMLAGNIIIKASQPTRIKTEPDQPQVHQTKRCRRGIIRDFSHSSTDKMLVTADRLKKQLIKAAYDVKPPIASPRKDIMPQSDKLPLSQMDRFNLTYAKGHSTQITIKKHK